MSQPATLGFDVLLLSIVLAIGWCLWTRRSANLAAALASEEEMTADAEAERTRTDSPSWRSRPLYDEEAYRLISGWKAVQARFIDDPKGAVAEADRLSGELLYARGLPLGDIETYAAAIAVEFPRLVKNYRFGRGVALRLARGQTNAEELRLAFIAYRALFQDLLLVRDPVPANRRAV